MKWLVGWGIVFVLSWGIGAIVCGIALFLKKYRATKIAALLFFGLPLLGLAADLIKQEMIRSNFERAKDEVARLCARDGGDKIYRTVENVQGVVQVRARPDAITSKPGGLSDQYGMVDPYGWAMGDRNDMNGIVGEASIREKVTITNARGEEVSGERNMPIGKQGYWFVEQQLKDVPPTGNRYLRTYLANNPSNKVSQSESDANPLFIRKQSEVSQLRSRYGYLTEDLTTKAMRDDWIGAGRIKIVDLQTNEVLAERTGYFRASGDLLPTSGLRWTASGAFHQDRICPSDSALLDFLHAVLSPPKGFPTKEQLESIAKEGLSLSGVGPLRRLDMHSLLSKFSAVLSVRRPILIPKTAL